MLSSAAALARGHDWRCTVVTSDRDSFALIDESTSVLRIIAGGVDASPLLTPARLPLLCGVQAGQYRDYAALRGDVSDNLPGANGIGAKTAAKLLQSFPGVAQVYAALDGGREEEVVAAVGAGGLPAPGRAAGAGERDAEPAADGDARRPADAGPGRDAGADGPGAHADRAARAGHPARAVPVGADRQRAAGRGLVGADRRAGGRRPAGRSRARPRPSSPSPSSRTTSSACSDGPARAARCRLAGHEEDVHQGDVDDGDDREHQRVPGGHHPLRTAAGRRR